MTKNASRVLGAATAAVALGLLWLLVSGTTHPANALAGFPGGRPARPGRAASASQVPGPALHPTDVTLTVSNSTYYSGNYQASGNSRFCETVTLGYPHRAESFTVEFPDDEIDLPVRTLSFDADTLPAGGSTRSFYLSVGVTTTGGAQPAAFVVRANKPQSKETGTATLKTAGGATELKIVGTNNMGVKLDVVVVCHP